MSWFGYKRGYNHIQQHVDKELRMADKHITNALQSVSGTGHWSRADLLELARISQKLRDLIGADIYSVELEEILG